MAGVVEDLLRENPVALLFTILAAGYLVGNFRLGRFALGPVTGVLFAGLVFGHYGYELSPNVQSFGFVLFIFSVGFQAGPGFFGTLRREGPKYFVLALVVAITGFALASWLAGRLDLPAGTAAGLLAGAMTTTPTLAAAQDTLRSGMVELPPGTTAEQAVRNVTTAYAITYLFGLIGLMTIIRTLPGVFGIDLPGEAKKIAGRERPILPAEQISVRAFRVEREDLVGRTRDEIREVFPGGASLVKLRREGEFVDLHSATTLQLGDEVTAIGRLDRFVDASRLLGPELTSPDLLDVTTESCSIVVTRKQAVGLTLGELDVGRSFHSVLTHLGRMQVDVPIEPDLALERGDVLSATGPVSDLERLGERLGHLERPLAETDLLTFALGIAVGILIGTFSVQIGNVSLGLGTAGGLLTTGLTIGWLRSVRPTFGRIPAAARWVFMELGLQMFMAGVGISAGAGILETLRTVGPSLILCGVAVTCVPIMAGWLVGSLVLRLNPAVLLGAITGAMTSGAALAIVNSAARSNVPALGYTGAYAFANVLLTVAGTLIVRF
jgi:putative transport protein